MTQEPDRTDEQERGHNDKRVVTALMLGLTLAVASIWAGSYYLKTPRTPAAKPMCEAVIIDIGTSALIGVPVYAPESEAGTSLIAALRCKNLPQGTPIKAELTLPNNETLTIDSSLEEAPNGWGWAVVDLQAPPAGEYEIHFTANGQEIARTWFVVTATEGATN